MTARPETTLAIDAMGGDRGPATLVTGLARFLSRYTDAHALLVGASQTIAPLHAAMEPALARRVRCVSATQEIVMGDTARDALRKSDSSMHKALDLVHEGRAAACVSCGNTAALMAVARHVVNTLSVVRRPAIVSAIPAIGGHTFMLDLGANSDCSAELLYQFAVMGECVAREAADLPRPRVGLLNLGQESSKGTPTVREAGRLLEASELNYVGFVEGHDIFLGNADVVVSDGFAGNVALKTMEGMARLVSHYLQHGGQGEVSATLASVKELLDPRLRNGATLVGLRRVVVKSHGGADELAFAHALLTAWQEIQSDVPASIEQRFAALGHILKPLDV